MLKGAEIVRTYDRLIARDSNFRTAWDLIASYIQPTRTDILLYGLKVPGTDQTRQLFDSTPVTACETAAAFIWGNVMNPATPWLSMAPRNAELNDMDEVREWRDEVIKIMLAAYLNSNFYYESYEALIDYLGFGTCDLHIEEKRQWSNKKPELGFRGFTFTNNPIGSFVIDEDHNGEVNMRWVKYSRSANAIKGEFGEDHISAEIKNALKDNGEKQFEIINCITPRDYGEQMSKAAKHMPFASYWVEVESKNILRESGYEEFPDAIARMQKTAGEVYGRGYGFTALPDIRSLNQLKYDSFESLEMAVKPPILSAVEEGALGTFQLFPGGFNTVKLRPGMTDVRHAVAPFESGTRWDVTALKEEELRASIERIFHVKQIRDILEAEKTQTLGEWAGKLALLNKMMGPIWGRMQSEFLNNLNERCFNIMFRRRAFPDPPEILLQDGAEIDWRYEGPLAKAQRAGEIDSIMVYAQQASIIGQFQPRALHRFNGDEAMKVLAEVGGVPGKVTRSDDEVEQILEGERQALHQEMAKEDMLRATEAAKNVAPLAQQVVGQPGV